LFSSEACVSQEPVIHSVYEEKTGTWQYVVADSSSQTAVIIDPVLDYDPATQVVGSQTADSLLSMIKEKGYKIDRILETHAHADHLTAASYLQDCLAERQGHRPPICIGQRIREVQRLFGRMYDIPAHEYEDVFDKLFDDDETFDIGRLTATIVHLPGHTPDHVGYKIGGRIRDHALTFEIRLIDFLQVMCSAVIPSSMQTLALHAVISPAAAPTTCTTRDASYSHCRTIQKSGQVMTIPQIHAEHQCLG
jgi:hypothetical protein